MKRRIIRSLASWACVMLWYMPSLSAQSTISMPYNDGPVSITLNPPANCYYTFTDNGGAGTPYGPQSGPGSVITFWPSSPGNKIVVQFTSFHTEEGFDALFVYDGPGVASPPISSGATALLGIPNPFSGGTGGWQGSEAPYNVAPKTVRATAANATGALSFAFDSDLTVGKSGWTAIVSEVPGNTCSIQAAGALTVAAPAGACDANVQTVPPAIVPGACSLALELHYRINDGPAVTVSTPAPPSITLNDVPVGVNVVTWELVAPCGGGLAASAAQLITVTDQTPPIITVPANITLNLGPGDCSTPYNYTVSAYDNCTFTPVSQVSHPIDFDNGAAGVMFDVKNLSAERIEISEFGPVLEPGVWPVEIYVTTVASTWQGVENMPSAWTLAGTRSAVSTGAGAGIPLSGFRIALDPGESRGIYIASTLGAPVRCTGINGGVQRQFDDGALRVSSAPGASVGYPFGQTYVSRAYNGYVKCSSIHALPELISGLPSGADFPAGLTVNMFKCTDKAGNTATASFSVKVQPYANATNTLICAGNVNVSLGPACSTTIQADDILFGGPYRCFDSYVVQLDKIPPFNDGPWVPATLGSADIGKTYGVRVTDPVNDNTCMGTVLVEDKLPPVITGDTVDLPCNFDISPTYKAPASVVKVFSPAGTLPANVLDFQTLSLNIPASAPADAVVEDVDLHLRITGDVFEKNLRVELENPAGTTVTLWNQATGCTGPLWVRFDDEGNSNSDCAQFTTNQHARIPFSGGLLSVFKGTQLAGSWKLRIRDLNGYSDVATLTEAQLIVRYKASFSSGFPNNLTFPGQLTQVTPNSFVAPAPLLDNCSDVTLSYSDETTSKSCATGLTAVVQRSWTARDASHNTTGFVQTIRLMRPGLEDVVLPPDYNEIDAPAFECGNPYPTPAWIESQGKQGFPHVFGQPNGCSVNWSYTDGIVDVCPGSYTINRNWLIIDACSAQSRQAMQQIRVLDRKEPQMNCPANLTVSTGLYNCCANVNLPDVVVEDACSPIAGLLAKVVVFNQYSGDTVQVANVSGMLTSFPGNNTADPDTLAAFGVTACLPVGSHHVYYKVEDACGNQKTCSFKLTIRDYTAPVAVGNNTIIVSLNADDPNDCYEPDAGGASFAGVTTLSATTFDQGSYDNCNFVRVTVRRQPPYSACIQSLNAANGGPPCNDAFPDVKSEYARATGESDSIKFYCCEAGTTQMLVLRCYQLDAQGNFSAGPDGAPIFNEALVQVEVQDKLKPGCQSPPDVTVSCENFDPGLSSYGLPELLDNCCLDTTKKYMNLPGLTHNPDYTQFDTVCSRGTVLRTFVVHDCKGQTSQCSQRIVVTHTLNYAIRFPDDVVVASCDTSGIYGKPVFHGEDCEQFAVSYHDAVFTVIPDACYQIERTWRVINLCAYLPGAGCVIVPNPTPSATATDPSNMAGPVVSPPGTQAPWTSSTTKITPADPQPTDYSSFWNGTLNCYEYKQVIKVLDTEKPLILDCPAPSPDFCDSSQNDVALWNHPEWTDPVHQTHDLNEASVDLSVTATDLCAGANINARYLLFLDTDNDGIMETVINSNNPPAPGQVNVDNAGNANFSGGTPRPFDNRPVAANEIYRWAVHQSTNGTTLKAYVQWKTLAQLPVPGNAFGTPGIAPQLPHGKHKIKWIISDGCGNETFCEYNFKIEDCKPPTVVCLNGLSVNIMPTDMVQLWATDFLQYVQDNCTPPTPNIPTPNQMVFAVRKAGQGTGFPIDGQGNPLTNIEFTCADLGPQQVELWARDKADNAAFCIATVTIQDNGNYCDPNDNPANITVAGALKTESDEGLAGAMVNLQGTPPNNGIPIDLSTATDDQGNYIFNDALPVGSNYTVVPSKDDNPLNGVSTYDLVLISKHILGLEPFDSPYKMIAADANKSNSITTFDIVEFRKLILGIYSELPDNTSWRFVDKAFVFPQPTNPFSVQFPETKSLADVQTDQLADDFVGIKIGDVNNTAIPNSVTSVNDRAGGILLFDVQDRDMKAGDVIDVNFKNDMRVLGFQLTLNLSGLEVADIVESESVKRNNFGVFPDALTVSIDGAGEFTVTFRATKSGKLSDMLGVSSRITRAEAYSAMTNPSSPSAAEKMDIALRFNNGFTSTISCVGFELYQNQPNPFVSKTAISFHLPEATEASLILYDETGRLLFAQKGQFGKGYNAVTIDPAASGISTIGVVYYKLETATDTAVRKMIRLR